MASVFLSVFFSSTFLCPLLPICLMALLSVGNAGAGSEESDVVGYSGEGAEGVGTGILGALGEGNL